MAVNSKGGASSDTMGMSDQELKVRSTADESINAYRNSTGEKEVEKWREKGCVWKQVDKEKGVSTMDLRMKTEGFGQDLADSGWRQAVVEAAGDMDKERPIALTTSGERGRNVEQENHGATEEQDNSCKPHNSSDVTSRAIRSPGVQQMRTASEWDPGPGELKDAIPATKGGKALHTITFGDLQAVERRRAQHDIKNAMSIAVKTIFQKPMDSAVQYLWPPKSGIQWAYHNTVKRSIAILKTSL
jgi:hypothetical protein